MGPAPNAYAIQKQSAKKFWVGAMVCRVALLSTPLPSIVT